MERAGHCGVSDMPAPPNAGADSNLPQRLVSQPPCPPCSHRRVCGHSRATGSWTTNKAVALVLRDARGAVCRQRRHASAAGPWDREAGALGQVAAGAELPSAFVLGALGWRPRRGVLPQEGHASSSLSLRARKTGPSHGARPSETLQPLVAGGNAQVGTRAEGGCSLPPRHDPQSPGQRPVAIGPSSEETRPPIAAPQDGPDPGRPQDTHTWPAIAPAVPELPREHAGTT